MHIAERRDPNKTVLTYDELQKHVIAHYAQEHYSSLMLPEQIRNLRNAFPSPQMINGLRILDIGCGCIAGTLETKFRDHMWAPWLCRLVQMLGGKAEGIDLGIQSEKDSFKYHMIDITSQDAFAAFGSYSFDAINCTNLFSSPHLVMSLRMKRPERVKLMHRIREEISRLLKPQGVVIAFDERLDNH